MLRIAAASFAVQVGQCTGSPGLHVAVLVHVAWNEVTQPSVLQSSRGWLCLPRLPQQMQSRSGGEYSITDRTVWLVPQDLCESAAWFEL